MEKIREKLNPLLFTDDLKLFTKGEAELDGLVDSVLIYSTDIKFGLSNYGAMVIKRRNLVRID